jgi:hypothetical protein
LRRFESLSLNVPPEQEFCFERWGAVLSIGVKENEIIITPVRFKELVLVTL